MRKSLLLFTFLSLAGGTVLAQQSAQKVRDSLALLYVSAVRTGDNLIVDGGNLKAIFTAAGKPVTPFLFTDLKPGLGSDFIAQTEDRYVLLNSAGEQKGSFGREPIYVNETLGQYESRNLNTRIRYNANAVEVRQAGYHTNPASSERYGRTIREGTLYGMEDTFGRIVLPPLYKWVGGPFSWGFAAQKGDLVFVFTPSGKLRFKSRADGVKAFPNGAIAVQLKGKWAFKDTAGKRLTPYEFNGVRDEQIGRYLKADNTILDATGKKLFTKENNYATVLPGNWLQTTGQLPFTKVIWDENFRPLFWSGKWEIQTFIGNRFVHLKQDFSQRIPDRIYDRKTKSFTPLLVETVLESPYGFEVNEAGNVYSVMLPPPPEELYVVYDSATKTRKILKGDVILPLPRFTRVESSRSTSIFFKILEEGERSKDFLEKDTRPRIVDYADYQNDSDLVGLINATGNLVVPPMAKEMRVLGKNLVFAYFEKEQVSRIYSNTGKVLFQMAGKAAVSGAPHLVQLVTKEESVLLDDAGKPVFKGKESPLLLYTNATKSRQTTLPDLLLYEDSSGYAGLYNLAGVQLLPHQYYPVAQKVPGLFSLKKGDSLYFVNTKGRLLYGGRGFAGEDYYVLEGYGILLQNQKGKWGILGASGKAIVPFEWEELRLLKEPQKATEYVLGKMGRWALLNNVGQLRYPPQAWKPIAKAGRNTFVGSDSHYYKIEGGQATKTTAAAAWLADYKFYASPQIPYFFDIRIGHPLPAGIYNAKAQKIGEGKKPFDFNGNHPLLFVTDSATTLLSVMDTTGKTVIPPHPMPAGIVANKAAIVFLYADEKDLLFRRQRGAYKEESIRVDSAFAAQVRSRKEPGEVVRNQALSFITSNGRRGKLSAAGDYSEAAIRNPVYPND